MRSSVIQNWFGAGTQRGDLRLCCVCPERQAHNVWIPLRSADTGAGGWRFCWSWWRCRVAWDTTRRWWRGYSTFKGDGSRWWCDFAHIGWERPTDGWWQPYTVEHVLLVWQRYERDVKPSVRGWFSCLNSRFISLPKEKLKGLSQGKIHLEANYVNWGTTRNWGARQLYNEKV